MTPIRKLVLAVTACLLSTASYSHHPADQSFTYKNQRGSTLSLVWHNQKNNTGTLTGTFTSAVGACKADVGVPLPVTGFFNGSAIAIAVNFPACNQVVTMTGNLMHSNEELNTLYLGAQPSKDILHKDWNSNAIGVDHFERIKASHSAE